MDDHLIPRTTPIVGINALVRKVFQQESPPVGKSQEHNLTGFKLFRVGMTQSSPGWGDTILSWMVGISQSSTG